MKFVFFGLMVTAMNAQASCGNVSSVELWSLIKTKHPKLAQAKAWESTASASLDSAKVRPNPELSVAADAGETLEGDVRSIEAGLMIPIELGGKRSARMELAHKTIRLAQKSSELTQADALIESYLQIHRLRQIDQVTKLQQDAIKTMKRYRDNLSKRASLSPEQEVELGALELALSDMELKSVSLSNERQEIARHIGFYAGFDCAIGIQSLPSQVTFNSLQGVQEVSDGEVALAQLRVEQAQADMELAKANASRNISVGPIVRYEKENFDEIYAVGLSVNFELPFFDRNQGERTSAAKSMIARELELSNIRRESKFDLETWQRRYEQSVQSLKATDKRNLLQQKREKVERFFSRGVISASLVIETYRQLIEFTQSRNDFEISALEAQAQILKLTGKINQLKL